MGTTTAIMHIGEGDRYHSGIQTELMVTLSENDCPYLNPCIMEYERKEKLLFVLGLESKEFLEEGPISAELRMVFEEREISLGGNVEVRRENGYWRLKTDNGPGYGIGFREDQEEIKVFDMNYSDVMWKKVGGYNEDYIPIMTQTEDRFYFFHPVTDLLLTFCIKKSKASNKLMWVAREATGEDNQDWIDHIKNGVDNLSKDDYKVWKKWKDYIWGSGRTSSVVNGETSLEKARRIMINHKFEGKIVVVLLQGISREAYKGFLKNLEDLKTEIVLLDQIADDAPITK